jgi:Ca-activated chloride channel family protein
MELAHPHALWLLAVLAPWAAWTWGRRGDAMARGPRLRHPALGDVPEARAAPRPWPWLLQGLGLVLLVLAAAQPREAGDWIRPPPVGRDIMLVIDTSLTMSLEDFQRDGHGVSRMAVLRDVLSDFVARRPADRFGLAVFASEAATLTPPTFDRAHVRAQLARLQVGVLGDDTALGDALGLALQPLQAGRLRPAIVLVSDGEPSNAGDLTPAEAVAVARQLGVRIHTLQVGAPSRAGAVTPDAAQPTLAEIAALTGGGHWQVRSAADASAVMRAIDRLEPTLVPPARERSMREWFWLPLLLGALCLALAQGLRAARGEPA